jgi:sulfur relay (sulfurtransferase) complex TusBCD TusD component (DsrE family)
MPHHSSESDFCQLLADAVACAKPGQKTAEGNYDLERMLRALASKEIPVGACGRTRC